MDARGEDVRGVAFCKLPKPNGLGESAGFVLGKENAGAEGWEDEVKADLGASDDFGASDAAFVADCVDEVWPNPAKGVLADCSLA